MLVAPIQVCIFVNHEVETYLFTQVDEFVSYIAWVDSMLLKWVIVLFIVND